MKRVIVIFTLTTIFLLSNIVSCTTISSRKNAKEADKLFELINGRLSYMKDVAAFKWVNKKPIEDLAREEVVIQKTAEAAGKAGLDEESTKQFFRVQIEAAKQIQRGWHKEWQENGFPEDAKFADLTTEIRPALIELGDDIIVQIKTTMPVLSNSSNEDKLKRMIKSSIKVKHVDEITKEQLLEALTKIESAK